MGTLHPETKTIELVASAEVRAHRASNTQLLPRIDELLAEHGIGRDGIACVACGRGPGSFTGVRIAMATAKGVASALGVGLVGFSTLDAVAWNAWAAGVRGSLLVAADAMRKEVYPVRYDVDDEGAHRLEADRVIKAVEVPESDPVDHVIGDALVKYEEILAPLGAVLPQELWEPTGKGPFRHFGRRGRLTRSTPRATTPRSRCRCTRVFRMRKKMNASVWQKTIPKTCALACRTSHRAATSARPCTIPPS